MLGIGFLAWISLISKSYSLKNSFEVYTKTKALTQSNVRAFYYLTASFRTLPALNTGVVAAEIVISAPV